MDKITLQNFLNEHRVFDGLAVEVGEKSGKASITWPRRNDPANKFSGLPDEYKNLALVIDGKPVKAGYVTIKAGNVLTPETALAAALADVNTADLKTYATAQKAAGRSEDEILLELAAKLAEKL